MIRASLTIIAGRLLAGAANLTVVAWLTQLLSQGDLGRYGAILALASAGSVFADMGQRIYLTRTLPLVRDPWPLVRRSLTGVVGVASVLGLLWMGLGSSLDGLAHAAIGSALLGLLGLNLALVGALAGTGRVVWGGLAHVAFRPLGLLLVLWLVSQWSPIDVTTALLAQLGAIALSVFIAAHALRWARQSPLPPTSTPPAPWLSTSLPLMILGGLGVLSFQVDVLIVRWVDSPEGAGIYFNATALAVVPSYALGAANSVIMPQVSRAWAEQRLADVHVVLGKSLRLALIGWAPAVVGVVTVFQLGVDLGWTFAEGLPILIVLLVGQSINVWCGSVGATLLMSGHERLVATTYAGTLLLNVAISIVLVPLVGPVGAAIGTASAVSAWNLWLVATLRARVGVDTSIARHLWPLPISAPSPNRSS
ncbi:MAG: polysaccharide biosynthesis C-terminal domain-containing protein [Myxococcota bacterium]